MKAQHAVLAEQGRQIAILKAQVAAFATKSREGTPALGVLFLLAGGAGGGLAFRRLRRR